MGRRSVHEGHWSEATHDSQMYAPTTLTEYAARHPHMWHGSGTGESSRRRRSPSEMLVGYCVWEDWLVGGGGSTPGSVSLSCTMVMPPAQARAHSQRGEETRDDDMSMLASRPSPPRGLCLIAQHLSCIPLGPLGRCLRPVAVVCAWWRRRAVVAVWCRVALASAQ